MEAITIFQQHVIKSKLNIFIFNPLSHNLKPGYVPVALCVSLREDLQTLKEKSSDTKYVHCTTISSPFQCVLRVFLEHAVA